MTPLKRAPLLLSLLLGACSEAPSSGEVRASSGAEVSFEDEVLPILEARCFNCHGPEAKRAKGGLRLTGRDALLAGGLSGPALSVEDFGASLLLKVIRYEELGLEMPPDAPLPEAEREILEQWILAGAPWEDTEATPEEREDAHFFEQSIRPLLAERCFECHGPEHPAPKGDLRMTGRDAFLTGGLRGSALTPGAPEESLLIHAVRYTDSLLKMPPRDRLSSEEVALLEQWIRRGAPWPGGAAAREDSEGVDVALGREWWSFKQIERPDVRGGAHPVDALLAVHAEAASITPNPLANDEALVRRAYQDLTGLPPTPEALREYVESDDVDKWPALIEELLESKQYGVRYARHWLDVVRFAQTNGYERDREKPYAWKYRDWVVHALNSDMPYDEFLRWQLAGDEIDGADRESFAATGFLRLGPWDSEPDDRDQADFDQYDDMVRTISEGFLGVTIGCARCHDHKFDPIRQEDYYGMVAFVRNVLPYRKPTFSPEARSFAILDFDEGVRKRWERGKVERRRELLGEQAELLETERRKQILGLLPSQSTEIQDAFWTPKAERTPAQRALLNENQDLAPSLEEVKESLEGDKRLRYALLKHDAERLQNSFEGDLDWILCAKEAGVEAAPTHLFARGSARSPREVIPPHFPPAMCVSDEASKAPAPTPQPSNSSTGLRTVLADWITDPQHPTTARVIANRIWLWHFGAGIVQTPNDFGKKGMAPSNPELLDWLAAELIESGWSLKHLHRVILTSEAYRRSSQETGANAQADPENSHFWRQNMRRLDAESARDSMLRVSGELSLKMGGRGFFPQLSKGALGGASRPGEGWGASLEGERSRRALYAYSKRNMRVPFLEVLDQANPEQSVGARSSTTVPTQTLTLMNSAFVNQQAAKLASRTLREAGSAAAEDAGLIERMFQLVLQRSPSSEEQSVARALLQEQRVAFAEGPRSLTFASRVPDRLQLTYLEELEPSALLHGPAGWDYLKGAWLNEYNETLESHRLRGPVALHPEHTALEAELSFTLLLRARGARAAVLLRGSEAGADYRGLSVIFDSEVGQVSVVHHKHPDLPSEVLLSRDEGLPPGESLNVNILLLDGEHPDAEGVTRELERLQVRYSVGSQEMRELILDELPLTRGARIGLSAWGEGASFDSVRLGDARHPDLSPTTRDQYELLPAPRDAEIDALTSLALVLLNTNEFLYVE
ncbi:MAG: PSD1 and planctomycete cytochrome C domain-containing protein [Planctomycetes bacterium]|nr:PSD1 and planctomycete cytochrome C domain-containing protein [Planctomycetota bacterium]